jgi:ribosomal protein S4E
MKSYKKKHFRVEQVFSETAVVTFCRFAAAATISCDKPQLRTQVGRSLPPISRATCKCGYDERLLAW